MYCSYRQGKIMLKQTPLISSQLWLKSISIVTFFWEVLFHALLHWIKMICWFLFQLRSVNMNTKHFKWPEANLMHDVRYLRKIEMNFGSNTNWDCEVSFTEAIYLLPFSSNNLPHETSNSFLRTFDKKTKYSFRSCPYKISFHKMRIVCIRQWQQYENCWKSNDCRGWERNEAFRKFLNTFFPPSTSNCLIKWNFSWMWNNFVSTTG